MVTIGRIDLVVITAADLVYHIWDGLIAGVKLFKVFIAKDRFFIFQALIMGISDL